MQMKEDRIQEVREESFLDELEKQYINADNKAETDYWAPLSKIIMESIFLRDSRGMSQSDLADAMKTKQSVISRFENMGRLPNYDFFARLALALGHAPGMTLCGDYMAVVPIEQQNLIKKLAEKENISTKNYVQNILDVGIQNIFNQSIYYTANICNEIQNQVIYTSVKNASGIISGIVGSLTNMEKYQIEDANKQTGILFTDATFPCQSNNNYQYA